MWAKDDEVRGLLKELGRSLRNGLETKAPADETMMLFLKKCGPVPTREFSRFDSADEGVAGFQ